MQGLSRILLLFLGVASVALSLTPSRVVAQSQTCDEWMQTGVPTWEPAGSWETSLSAAESDATQAAEQALQKQANGSPDSETGSGCASDGSYCWATGVISYNSANQYMQANIAHQTIQGACPANPCAPKAGQPAFVGGGSPAGGDVCDGQCVVRTSQPTMVIRAGGGSSGPTVYDSSYTGQQCSSQTSGATVSPNPVCVASGGVTACADQSSKPNCGTFNGDEVCVTSIPPGTCESFASGGIACTASSGQSQASSPPAPDGGTPGASVTPAGSESGKLSGAQVTTDYYTASQVAASSASVTSSPGGQNVGNGGTSATGSSGSSGGGGDGKGNAGTSCGNGKTSSGSDCVDDSFSGGQDCSVPPSCSGDPIQCAQADQEFLMRCQSPVAADDVFGSGQTPQVSQLNVSGEGGDVSTMTDTSTFLSGGCLPDRVVNLGSWGSITLQLSQFCWVFQALGVMVMACAWIGAAKIVVGVNK